MSEPLEVLRGVVHPWYCDSFRHMNVRWYSLFINDAAFQIWPLYWGSQKKCHRQLNGRLNRYWPSNRIIEQRLQGY